MNIESINFLMDIIFKPLFGDNINKCKSRIKKSITSLRDNKIKYALYKLLENTKNMPYSYCDYGYISDLKKIDNDIIGKNIIQIRRERYILYSEKVKNFFKNPQS